MWKVVNHICQYFPLFAIISRYFPVNATGMANMLICRHFANLGVGGGLKFEKKCLKSTPKKKLGKGSPVFCTFLFTPTQ